MYATQTYPNLRYVSSCYQCIYRLGGGGYMDAWMNFSVLPVVELVTCAPLRPHVLSRFEYASQGQRNLQIHVKDLDVFPRLQPK